MLVKHNDIFPLIKISSFLKIDFLEEHNNLIIKNVFVWFCRFEKNNMKLEKINSCIPILLITKGDNDKKAYITKYSELSTTFPTNTKTIPKYYSKIEKSPAV